MNKFCAGMKKVWRPVSSVEVCLKTTRLRNPTLAVFVLPIPLED